MKTTSKSILYISIATVVLVFMVSYLSLSNKVRAPKPLDPEVVEYVAAFTSGTVSKASLIKVQLVSNQIPQEQINSELEEQIFEFEPALKGITYWEDERTLVFDPANDLESGQNYLVKFNLGKLMEVPEHLQQFEFGFRAITQTFKVTTEGLYPFDENTTNWQRLRGIVKMADVADQDKVEQLLTAVQGGKKLTISWVHNNDQREHHFLVDSISRGNDASEVILEWDGDPIGVDIEEERSVTIPALGDFRLLEARVVQSPEQYVLLQFSDPIQKDQELRGLIRVGELSNLMYVIDGNEIKVYPSSRQSGTHSLQVDVAVRNHKGYQLQQAANTDVTFEEIKPEVKLIGSGVIIPNSDGLWFPFEAVSLRAVDLKIIQVYENNITQFLQVNDLRGSRQLKRVGRVAFRKTIDLDEDKLLNKNKWNRFSIDLNKMIDMQPGALYRVELSFKQQHSLYPCGENQALDNVSLTQTTDLIEENWDSYEESESSYWDYYEESYDYWENRSNPCHKAYYDRQEPVSRNILASDLGLIAKRGEEGTMKFWATNLLDAQPMENTLLEVYSYQQQLLYKTMTNEAGEANMPASKTKPFLLIAKNGQQRGYLKLDDGASLSMSRFDVDGQQVQKGIKGYLYGERGVWRPGDSLYLSFVLEDKLKSLPAGHPVSFTLVNPRGQLAYRTVTSQHVNGFYRFATTTSPDAPTGNWNATVRVGGVTFNKTLKIETVKPNRLKLKIDFGVDEITQEADNLEGELEVKWLHGAIARNLKADVKVSLTPTRTQFPKFSEYVFDDPVRSYYGSPQTVFDGELDDQGKATVTPEIYVNDGAPGKLMASFASRAFEPGGDFSIDRFSLPYHPYNTYVGLKTPKGDKARGMLLTDTNHTVNLVALDTKGKPMANRNLEVKLYKVDWKWWWDKSAYSVSNYSESRLYNELLNGSVTTNAKGEAEWTLRLDYPEWGRYLLRVSDTEGGHCTGKVIYMDWPGWAGKAQKEGAGGAQMLSFTTDKTKYEVGDEAEIIIPGSEGGRALLSLETGSKVIQAYWVDVDEEQTRFKFPITADMAPNIYAHVTMMQPHAQNENDLPIRLYGVIPILVEDPETHLEPVLVMEDELRPETTVSLKVKEKTGRPMTYTIAMVDEGLLDLTRFKTPNPWGHFFAREALGVKTWDMFEYVVGTYGGELGNMLAVGGGGDGKGKDPNKRANRFKPMVRFMGPFHLEPGATANHKVDIPQYIGSVRTMVVAGYEGAYGATEKATPVKKPLMVLGTLPRVLGPGESLELPVTVFAMDKKVKNVKVTVSGNKLLSVAGGNSKTIRFNQPGDDNLGFELKVKEGVGVGKVKIVAVSGNERAEHTIEIQVRNPNPRVTDVLAGTVENGKSWQQAYKPVGMAGTNKTMLEVSSIPPLNLGKRLQYLLRYPHGCVEQTTSSVFPQLFVKNLLDISEEDKAKIDNNVMAGIQRLKLFQTPEGGLGYWPGDHNPNDWGTNYAGHFLLEAEKQGYKLPANFKSKWISYQRNKARQWRGSSRSRELDQAYRLYTLALAGNPELGAMNRLREQKSLAPIAQWRLAAAYHLAGRTGTAKQMVANITTRVENYNELSGTFGSASRDRAMILETLSLMGQRAKATPIMKEISKALSGKEWMSTQSTAYCLLAMSRYVGTDKMAEGLQFTYTVAGGKFQSVSSNAPIKQVTLGKNSGTVSVKNTKSGILYVRLIREGIPVTGDTTSASNNLTVSVQYRDAAGNRINPVKIEQGTDFVAEVSVMHSGLGGTYEQLALTEIFPSGWEIHNARLDPSAEVNGTSQPTYQDIRDDRVYTYFDLSTSQTKVFKVKLNASYLGRYYLPTVQAEAMYDATINGRVPGQWVEVVPIGEGFPQIQDPMLEVETAIDIESVGLR